MAIAEQKIRREDLAPGEVLCAHCTAKCCRYFALPIETPTTWQDFDFIRWYLLHGQVSVFIEDENWYLVIHNRCDHLQEDQRCGIYDTRPQICREYSTDACEFEDEWVYERYFETPQQVYEFAEAVLGPPPGSGFRTSRPALLPILAS